MAAGLGISEFFDKDGNVCVCVGGGGGGGGAHTGKESECRNFWSVIG